MHLIFCFILLIGIVALDQLTKAHIEQVARPYEITKNFFGDLIYIRLVYNTGAAFSLGSEFNGVLRLIMLLTLPVIGLVALLCFALFSKDLLTVQRYFIFGILGGGIGNLIDRFFRPQGVVDFIDVKFFGIFGMERWPTFNVADMSVVIFGIALLISIIVTEAKKPKKTN